MKASPAVICTKCQTVYTGGRCPHPVLRQWDAVMRAACEPLGKDEDLVTYHTGWMKGGACEQKKCPSN